MTLPSRPCPSRSEGRRSRPSRKRHEADARPVVDVDHPNTVALAFEAMRALHVNSIPEIPRAFKTQLVKNSGNFYAWHVGQDETAKTKFPIRKGNCN
ncbi:hypothetical protein BLNAU_21493 [Blattamonas nauphoetae]|uniref:Uncharacterized protein n=1 Tax=Blattamonas nauphoetae TaxID=2049346 RepID=A0ABQ9WVT7_9EUKA|nr:hypothetical protein BLNAU_21493 [Blattamonas nauphoetae]